MLLALLAALVALVAGSSHSEAPGTARGPHTDLTDFYMFMTRRGNVALIANVAGLSQSQAGPNYNPLNNEFIYQIHVDNDGDALEDITFQFLTGYRYVNNGRGIELNINGVMVPVPLAVVAGGPLGPVAYNATSGTTSGLNSEEYYRVRVLAGDSYSTPIEDGPFLHATQAGVDTYEFTKAFDYAGTKTFGETSSDISNGLSTAYDAYVAGAAIYTDVAVPGCAQNATLFVGPRRESFGIALGEIFDALNIANGREGGNPPTRSTFAPDLGADFYDGNSLDRMSVISFVLEVPPVCLLNGLPGGDVLGAWASVATLEHRNHAGQGKHFVGEQTTRLGNPLVNELLIGTTFKNEWNSRHPSGDSRFETFLTNPVVPAYVAALNPGVVAPNFTRVDLVAVLHTGVPGLNLPLNQASQKTTTRGGHTRAPTPRTAKTRRSSAPTPSPTPAAAIQADILRLNVTASRWVICSAQNTLGVIGGDASGYPNGRRLGDDVVDITLRVAMGALCTSPTSAATYCGGAANIAPSGTDKFTDQAPTRACMFICDTPDDFPFLNAPIPGNELFQPDSPYTVSQFVRGCSANGTTESGQNFDILLSSFTQ